MKERDGGRKIVTLGQVDEVRPYFTFLKTEGTGGTCSRSSCKSKTDWRSVDWRLVDRRLVDRRPTDERPVDQRLIDQRPTDKRPEDPQQLECFDTMKKLSIEGD